MHYEPIEQSDEAQDAKERLICETRMREISRISPEAERRLEKSREIQWDYKSIYKRRGRLVRLRGVRARPDNAVSPHRSSQPAAGNGTTRTDTPMKFGSTIDTKSVPSTQGPPDPSVPLGVMVPIPEPVTAKTIVAMVATC